MLAIAQTRGNSRCRPLRSLARNEEPTPWVILHVRMLEYAVKMAQRYEAWGEPTEGAKFELAWLAGVVERGEVPLPVDLCLEVAEPEIVTRVHRRYGRCRSAEEYRQRAIAEIKAAWRGERERAEREGRTIKKLEFVLSQVRAEAHRKGQLCLF